METVQGGVPPYGVKETLVVNGGKKTRNSWSMELLYCLLLIHISSKHYVL